MSYAAEIFQARRDFVRMPGFRLAIVLSILLHAALLWKMPMRLQPPPGDASVPLTVQLVPPPSAAPEPPATPPAPPLAQVQPAPAPVRPPPAAAPPPIALAKPAPVIPRPEPPVSEPVPAPLPGDLAAYIEARRRESGEAKPVPAAPVEDENARASRVAAKNLRLQQPAIGYDPSKSGGIFEVKSRNIDYAEFMFFGWNLEIRRDIAQQFEVRRGNHATIELAIVRKMIEIIRQYEQDEFTWNSRRLGRSIKLSARLRDNAGLEEFMLREFFDAPPRR
jgi:hypothetical protein